MSQRRDVPRRRASRGGILSWRTAPWVAMLASVLLASGSTPAGARASERGATGLMSEAASMWLTTPDGSRRLTREPDLAILDTPADAPEIVIDARERHQAMLGFGASMTDSSAALIMRLPPDARDRLMRELFSATEGIGLNYLRQPIGPTDFVATLPYATYEAAGVFDPSPDERGVLPLLRAALSINSDVRLMGTPWTAPASMKDRGRLEGGRLRPDAYDAYADYLVSAIEAYNRAGAPISDLTVQNEPQHEAGYPSMVMSAEEQAAFIRVLDRRLTAAELETRLFAFDHNWDGPNYALEVLAQNRDVARLEGAAFHCYAGDPEAQAEVREAGWRVLHTECSGIDSEDRARTFSDTLQWQAERLLIRGPRSGSETAVTWNVALDESGGPHVGQCGDRCNGIVEISGDTYLRNAEFYVLGHASRFVRRGARRIGSEGDPSTGLRHVAFENPDGTRVLIVLNAASHDQRVAVSERSRSFHAVVPAGALATLSWPGRPWTPSSTARLDPSGWTLAASSQPTDPCCVDEQPANAIDGDPQTRWSTGAPQHPGQWLAVDLGAERSFDTLMLDDNRAGDHPRGYAVYAGNDPRMLGAPVATGTGTRGAMVITFEPVSARYLRIVQTGAAGSWWSVHTLALYRRDGQPPVGVPY